jgi:hypothetical protein
MNTNVESSNIMKVKSCEICRSSQILLTIRYNNIDETIKGIGKYTATIASKPVTAEIIYVSMPGITNPFSI